LFGIRSKVFGIRIAKTSPYLFARLKKDIIRRIKAVESTELQTILELRYLSYMRWEEIAIELGYGIDNVFRLHRNALDEIKIPETIQ
jgi:DNA-directed RNA polymerase specialized sigma subunit